MDVYRAMSIFVSTARLGGLAPASRHVGVSTASISRHISSLESFVGVRLLNRNSRSTTLTDAGKTYLFECERILQAVERANRMAYRHANEPIGTLKIHSRTSVGQQFIIPILSEFMLIYPDIKIVFRTSNEEINLNERDIDIDIRIGRMKNSELMVRKLTESERYVCASPEYIANAPPVDHPSDLSEHNCLAYRPYAGPVYWTFLSSDGLRENVLVRGTYETDYGPSLYTLAVSGRGIALLPEWAIRSEISEGRLVRMYANYRVTHTDADNGIYAVYKKEADRTKKVDLFLDYLIQSFNKPAIPDRPSPHH